MFHIIPLVCQVKMQHILMYKMSPRRLRNSVLRLPRVRSGVGAAFRRLRTTLPFLADVEVQHNPRQGCESSKEDAEKSDIWPPE